jgi:hypothetical protein
MRPPADARTGRFVHRAHRDCRGRPRRARRGAVSPADGAGGDGLRAGAGAARGRCGNRRVAQHGAGARRARPRRRAGGVRRPPRGGLGVPALAGRPGAVRAADGRCMRAPVRRGLLRRPSGGPAGPAAPRPSAAAAPPRPALRPCRAQRARGRAYVPQPRRLRDQGPGGRRHRRRRDPLRRAPGGDAGSRCPLVRVVCVSLSGPGRAGAGAGPAPGPYAVARPRAGTSSTTLSAADA